MAALPKEWRLFVLLLAHTGLRIGELLGLNWADIHLGDDARLSVNDQMYRGRRKALKTAHAYRTIPLSPGMALALHGWREETAYPAGGSPVFASSVGTPLDYSRLHRAVWKPARDAASIDPSVYGAFHRFRKTLGSLAHERGAKTNRQVTDWLGHADPAFTQRVYISQLDQGLGNANFLDQLMPVEGWTYGRHADLGPTDGDPSAKSDPHHGTGDDADPEHPPAAPPAASMDG